MNLDNAANGEIVLVNGIRCYKFFNASTRQPFLRRADSFEPFYPTDTDIIQTTGTQMNPYYSDYNNPSIQFHRLGEAWYENRD